MFKNKVREFAKALSEKIVDSTVTLNSHNTINSGFINEVLVTVESPKGIQYFIIGEYPEGGYTWRILYV
ncbi:hypothetical protein KNT81_gp050 [Proteus phage phiP4-3]|uniref:Uncharacterized protein n=1 Tax=Proteus phage phiP4-3 TaxID=2065203 RepID=A0A2I6PFA1_9CAUD|nr:hypothetical protein KNT81_gp050 [Proteus phage phiP4-3]AUM58408.1 hypothetical protein phiP43_050 [Proteus phage phiP4-3]AZV01344.1 hypothetical protein vBSdyM006_207 [Shigella phage vB_SdyM_006]QQV89509.1 hypothetical protein SJ_91 [Proteus phage SJ_PmiM]